MKRTLSILSLPSAGELNSKRYVSETAFKEFTQRQTPATVQDNDGPGGAIGPKGFGHGDAHAANMEIRPAQGVCKNRALERFAK